MKKIVFVCFFNWQIGSLAILEEVIRELSTPRKRAIADGQINLSLLEDKKETIKSWNNKTIILIYYELEKIKFGGGCN